MVLILTFLALNITLNAESHELQIMQVADICPYTLQVHGSKTLPIPYTNTWI